MEKNKPEKTIRASPVAATIWANEAKSKSGEKVVYKTVSLDRRYKDKDGKWKSTNSFRVTDLPKAALVLNKAFEYLSLNESNEIEKVEDDEIF